MTPTDTTPLRLDAISEQDRSGTGIVECVARAIDDVQLAWRFNNWTADRVKGFPIEIFRSGEPEVIIARFAGSEEAGENVLYDFISDVRAEAGIRATLEHLRDNITDEMIHAGILAFGVHVSSLNVEACFRAMIDAALSELPAVPPSQDQE